MMKITLQIGGREMTFSENQLIEILENHFEKQKEANQQEEQKMLQIAMEGKYFEVNPKAIDQELFSEKREDPNQEKSRQIILEAFTKISELPEKYGRPFKTLIPNKAWSEKNIKELNEIAEKLGDHMADWVEQALEWAQRIANGDTWETVCNEPDTEKLHRLVIWKEYGEVRIVGGEFESKFYGISASNVSCAYLWFAKHRFCDAVPLVVLY